MTSMIAPPVADPSVPPTLTLDASLVTTASLEVNGVPCVRAVIVRATDRLHGCRITIEIDGTDAVPFVEPLETIPAGGSLGIDTSAFTIPLPLLQGVTERSALDLVVTLRDAGDAALASVRHRLTVIPATHWCGVHASCESLASFVTPNAPELVQLLVAASDRLLARTGNGAIDGYLSDNPERPQRIAEACFEALAEQAPTYILARPSFEDEGQKVRTAAEVLGERCGNCLDLSLTLAAMLELSGLAPVIALGDGHAVVGFSTIDESFPDAVHDGPSRLVNRLELGELRMIEATFACDARRGFGDALLEGARFLRDASDRIRVLDVRAARRAGFHPLPDARALGADAPWRTRREVRATEWTVVRPAGLPPLPKVKRSARAARLEIWKKRLLDLTLRNRLLNDRDAAGIPLLADGDGVLAKLEDCLWNERTMKLVARGSTRGGAGGALADPDAATEELERGWLRAQLDDEPLFKRATKAFREGKSSLEETGARSLYIAIGYLEFRVETRDEPVRAPLLLVPVVMERISRSEGFRVVPVAEDTVPNVALVEYLRNAHGLDIGLAESLDQDENGIDVPAMLARVRKAVSDVAGARVIATAKLGNYSFKKLPIFEEMRARNKALEEHPVVRSLLDRIAADPIRRAPVVTPDEVERAAPFSEIRLPLAADSSQIAAICSATAGATFVLQGPPGTGKSQTIANLLAECLARGKRVLFIAEKSAALEVVSERLRKSGLSTFALDLHADHATKHSFVAQMKRSLEDLDDRAAAGSRRFGTVAAGLDRARARLAAVRDALHAERGEGLSAQRAIERAVSAASPHSRTLRAELEPSLEGALPPAVSIDDLEARIDRIDALARSIEALPPDALAHFGDTSPSQMILSEHAVHLSRVAEDALELLARLETTADECATLLGISPPSAPSLADALGTVADAFAIDAPGAGTLVEAALADDEAARLGRIRKSLEAFRIGAKTRKDLLDRYDESVLALEIDAFIGDLRANRDRFVLFRWLAAKKVRGQFVRHAKMPPPHGIPDLLRECDRLVKARALLGAGDAARTELDAFADADGALDAAAVQHALDSARAAASTLRERFPTDAAAVRARARQTVGQPALRSLAARLAGTLSALREILRELDEELEPTPAFVSDEVSYADLRARLAVLRDHARELPAWSACSVARRSACAVGLAPVADLLRRGALPLHDACDVAESALLSAWTRARMREESALADATGDRVEGLRGSFRAGVDEYRRGVSGAIAALVRDRASEALRADRADDAMRRALRTVNELRALTTIRRPIRRVMLEGAPAISALKPLVLASPLSATTLLPPEFPPFDLVVFDEASQVPVWDAACAMSRGAASVIVGDSKQLPPTNFFDRKESGEGSTEAHARDAEGDGAGEGEGVLAETLEPLDSVLDEAIASGFREQSLLWHYRSRDERLIEFSNRRSYGGRLQTFPAPHRAHPNLGVEFRFVGGVYDRARTSTNRAEAEAIVAEIARRLLDDDACTANRSIGVVTFSVAQQTLVQDLLDEAVDRDPALRARMAEAATLGEEVFVKNLENVQGDERATMLFSICYGRDAGGAMYHNFGPLNLSGGERRLNVAVTRAREKVVIFSSIRANDLDPSKCRMPGAKDLRDYLAFAEHGTVPSLRDEGGARREVAVSAIEDSIAAALAERGWRADLHVGRSHDYRIGIAVARADRPDRWLLGIELDGEFYGSAPTVVDRESVRDGVLGALGWRVVRVASIDWLRDPDAVLARIERELEAAAPNAS